MNMYIVAKEPFPFGMAATNRIICYAKALFAEKMLCNVLICDSLNESYRQLGNIKMEGIYEGISYRYLLSENNLLRFNSSNRLLKSIEYRLSSLLNSIQSICCLFRVLKKDDVVISYFNNNTLLLMLIVLLKIKGVIHVKELGEIPYYNLAFTSRIKRFFTLNIFFRYIDAFIVISRNLESVVNRYKCKKAKVLRIPILVDLDKYSFNHLKINAPQYILHSGTLTQEKDGIIDLLHSFKRISDRLNGKIKLIVTGNLHSSHLKNEILNFVSQNNLSDNIIFTGMVDNDTLYKLQENAFMSILYKKDTFQNKYCFSTKLAEYLASNIIVVSTNVGEASYYLENEVNSYIFNSPDELVEIVVSCYNNPEKQALILSNARELVAVEFDYKSNSRRLVNFISLLNE